MVSHALPAVVSAGSSVLSVLSELQVEDNAEAPGVVLTVTGAAIALFLLVFFNWVVGHSLTVVHEAGHAFVTNLLGGHVVSLTSKPNRDGLTVSVHPSGWGYLDGLMISAAGYIAPSVFGLGAADALAHGRSDVVLWGSVVLLALLLPSVRAFWTFFVILTFGFVLVVVATRADPDYQVASATIWAWLLLAGGIFQTLEHLGGGGDFITMSEELVGFGGVGAALLGLLYLALMAAITVLAGLLMVGAVQPWP